MPRIAPVENVDVHPANSPESHVRHGRFVEIDCIRSSQGPAVIVHLANLTRLFNLEHCALRPARPICGGTMHRVVPERRPYGRPASIADMVAFTIIVSGRSDVLNRRPLERFLVFGQAASSATRKKNC